MKNIILVGNSTWGMYNFRKGVILYLKNHNYNIIVASPPDEYTERLKDLGIEYVPLKRLQPQGANILADIRFFRELKSIYKKYKPELIFHYTIKPNIYGSLAASALKISSVAVVTGLGYTFTYTTAISFVAKALYKIAFKKNKAVWFLNDDDKNFFVSKKLLARDLAFVLPGEGVNTDFFKPSSVIEPEREVVKFLLISRMIYDKGIVEYVEASKILKSRGHKIESELLGFVEVINPKAITKETITLWEKEAPVRYYGSTPDVLPYIQRADCIVLPSFYREGIPRTLLEGASVGKPVITTNNVGCKEVVEDGVTGYLCKIKDELDLADKMEKFILLSNAEKKQMGQKGRERIKQFFDERIVCEIYLNTVKKLVK